ncbi:hypothetical protein SEF58_12550 [Neomoorella humiferrea]|uniref:hypothetical protein n=1 Tax=Neomoorella humiferrea TaxID=676965 RepID=UPI003D8B97F8
MEQSIAKKAILEIDPNKNIIKGELVSSETGEILTTDVGEILEFIYTDCGGVDIIEMYEEEQLKKAQREIAQKEYEFYKFKMGIYHEAFEQSNFMPGAGIKALIVLPIAKLLSDLKEKENPNKITKWIIEKIIPPARKMIVAFLFGKENAKEIDRLIEEAREKYLS